jgi:hypothetical protein
MHHDRASGREFRALQVRPSQPCMRTEAAAGVGANFDQGWICPELRPPTDRSSQFRYNSETELAIET